MRRLGIGLALLATVALQACGDHSAQVLAPRPRFQVTAQAPACLDATGIYGLIDAVFPAGNDRTAAEARFDNIDQLLGRGDAADTATAQEHVLTLVAFTVKKYRDGMLIAGTTAETVTRLINGLLCYSGLPQVLDPNALGPDGAIAFISPTTDTTLVTGTRWAGADFDSGSVTQTVLVTISRVPPAGEALATLLDTYPLYYEFTVTPAQAFTEPIIVGVCQPEDLNLDPAVQARLRLAHNVGPVGARTLEILDLAPAPFLDCTGASALGMSSGSGFMGLASRGWSRVRPMLTSLLPSELAAATAGAGGVGGTVRTFSPFGAVDPQVDMDPNSDTTQSWPIGGTVPSTPSVKLHTHNGTPLSGLAVAFAVGANGGSITGASQSTDASGIATVGSWTLGPVPGVDTVFATATPPHTSSYVLPNPRTFKATANPPTQLRFDVQPSTTTAGQPIAPPVKVSVTDDDGHVVTASSAAITVALGTHPAGSTLGGTKTVAAVQGVGTFADLTLTTAGSYSLIASSGTLRPTTSSPFSITSAAAASLVGYAGNSQTALEGTAVAVPPAVRVTDQYGNPVPGVQITFQDATGAGSITGATPSTDANGVAAVGSWTLAAGPNTLYAYVTPGTGPDLGTVVFTATGTTLATILVDCLSGGGSDDLSRGFYLPANSTLLGRARIGRLKQVTLYMSSNDGASTPTSYTIRLIASYGFNASSVVGTADAAVAFRGNASQNQAVSFVFPGAPAVDYRQDLTFRFQVLYRGGNGTLTFNSGSCGLGDTRCKSGCPLVETNDTSGSLSTFRRKGCGIQIIGSPR